jgi:hypothetical protein
MTDVDSIIRIDHSFLPLQPALQYTFGEFEYIFNDSLKEMLKHLYKDVSLLNLWSEMKEGDFKTKLIQKNIKYNIEFCKNFCLEMYPCAIHIIHHIALHGEEDFRYKYTLKKLKKLF